MRSRLITLVLVVLSHASIAQEIDSESVGQAFDEFQLICRKDNGALWGKSLCGRLMVVDPETRQAWFNVEPPIPHRKLRENLYTAKYPADSNVANTSITWNGQRWIQMISVPDDPHERRALLVHEAFHGFQDAVGFRARDEMNDHLEDERARLWLRLEAKALEAALADEEQSWLVSLHDALSFNRRRAILYPESRSTESSLVNHEGLAEYTGIRLGGGIRANEMAIDRLESAITRPSLVRSVGYVLGPAYGLLLDRTGREWREAALAGAPLPLLLEAAISDHADLEAAAAGYGYAEIAADEKHRGEERATQVADLRRRFIDGPVLILPFRKMNVSFDPNRVVALEGHGTIRSGARIRDLWGTLEVEGDVMFDSNWSSARVPLGEKPDGSTISGDGWNLTLENGWKAVPGERDGDWILQAPE